MENECEAFISWICRRIKFLHDIPDKNEKQNKWLEELRSFARDAETLKGLDSLIGFDEDSHKKREEPGTVICPECGGIAKPSGSCHVCCNCGTSLGCS